MTATTRLLHNQRLWVLSCIAFIAWAIIGVFPLSCYESDAMHIIAGCNDIVTGGANIISPRYTYAYDMQPLVTTLIVMIKRVIPLATCEQIYCMITAIAAAFLCVGSFKIAQNLTNGNKWGVLLSIFLIPEAYACAYYPNSSVLAMSIFVWGLLMIEKRRYIVAGILLVIAPLLRVDVFIVYPVIFLILIRHQSLKSSVLISSIYAISVLTFSSVIFYILGANPLNSFFDYQGLVKAGSFASEVKFAIITFYTIPGFILVVIAIVTLCRNKKFILAATLIVPMLLIHYMFRSTGCATKHYLYLLPFVITLFYIALNAIVHWRSKLLKWSFIGCYILFLFGSVTIDLKNSPWRNDPDSEFNVGPRVNLATFTLANQTIHIGIGAGQPVPTFDEYMLVSGNAFYPLWIHRFKTIKDERRREAYELLKGKDFDIMIAAWGDKSFFINLLFDNGWHITKFNPNPTPDNDFLMELSDNLHRVQCYFPKEIDHSDMNALEPVLKPHRDNNHLYYVPELERMEYILENEQLKGNACKLSQKCYKIQQSGVIPHN